jgi:hypothetical protein
MSKAKIIVTFYTELGKMEMWERWKMHCRAHLASVSLGLKLQVIRVRIHTSVSSLRGRLRPGSVQALAASSGPGEQRQLTPRGKECELQALRHARPTRLPPTIAMEETLKLSITDQLYHTPTRFLLELIQNADQ